MPQPVFALIDCNNFFVSCERVFRPDLWHKPVAVLSNNDACIVARSNEVKALGVPMAAPYFQVRDILKKHNVQLFSANFQLYGDLSQRVVRILQTVCPTIEVYSVDESFLDVSALPIKDYTTWARELRAHILQLTGLPVSIGVAPTKTLAKAASDFAKKNSDYQGALSIMDDPAQHKALLEWLPVGDVWGVGYRTRPMLEGVGIKTGYALSQVSDAWAQANLTIRGVRMVRELKGQSCIGLDSGEELQKSLERSRSFGHTIRDYYELEGAVATFAAQAAAKLRGKDQLAGEVVTYLYGKRGEESHRSTATSRLLPPSNNTGTLINAALRSLQQAYDPEFGYKKAGVVLLDLRSTAAWQLELGADLAKVDKQVALMRTVDTINARLGTRQVRHASEHLERNQWFSRKDLRSPNYTTRWTELARVH